MKIITNSLNKVSASVQKAHLEILCPSLRKIQKVQAKALEYLTALFARALTKSAAFIRYAFSKTPTIHLPTLRLNAKVIPAIKAAQKDVATFQESTEEKPVEEAAQKDVTAFQGSIEKRNDDQELDLFLQELSLKNLFSKTIIKAPTETKSLESSEAFSIYY